QEPQLLRNQDGSRTQQGARVARAGSSPRGQAADLRAAYPRAAHHRGQVRGVLIRSASRVSPLSLDGRGAGGEGEGEPLHTLFPLSLALSRKGRGMCSRPVFRAGSAQRQLYSSFSEISCIGSTWAWKAFIEAQMRPFSSLCAASSPSTSSDCSRMAASTSSGKRLSSVPCCLSCSSARALL